MWNLFSFFHLQWEYQMSINAKNVFVNLMKEKGAQDKKIVRLIPIVHT